MSAPRKNHVWTNLQVDFVVSRWGAGRSQEGIADDLLAEFGLVVSRNSVSSVVRRNRDRCPSRVTDHPLQLQRLTAPGFDSLRGMRP